MFDTNSNRNIFIIKRKTIVCLVVKICKSFLYKKAGISLEEVLVLSEQKFKGLVFPFISGFPNQET